MNQTEISKFIALILRHRPEIIGISLDAHGFADVEALLKGIQKTYPLTREGLEKIVREDSKQRYAFNADHSKIRANQGHSISVDLEFKAILPPPKLYHGTGEKSVASIKAEGLKAMSRLYVHLSEDESTARKVGSRHGKPVVFLILAKEMSEDGFLFYRSENGVWLTKEVPAKYLKQIRETI